MSFQHWNVKVKFINENDEEIELREVVLYKEKVKESIINHKKRMNEVYVYRILKLHPVGGDSFLFE